MGTNTTMPASTSATTTVPLPETTVAALDTSVAAAPDPILVADTPSPTAPSQTRPAGGLLALLDSLVVAAEHTDGYDRDLFRHWVDADSDGCDTRREVLITKAVTAPSVGGDCALSDGVWVSRYDAETETGSRRGFDINHLVPLKEAWESDAHAWDPETREHFANDLGYEHSLVAVSARSNRSKGCARSHNVATVRIVAALLVRGRLGPCQGPVGTQNRSCRS